LNKKGKDGGSEDKKLKHQSFCFKFFFFNVHYGFFNF